MSSSEPGGLPGTLQVVPSSGMTEIRITDAVNRRIQTPDGNTGELTLSLAPGVYHVAFRDGTSWAPAKQLVLWPGKTEVVKQEPSYTPSPNTSQELEDAATADALADNPARPLLTVRISDPKSDSLPPERSTARLEGIRLEDVSGSPAQALDPVHGDRSSQLRWQVSPGYWILSIAAGDLSLALPVVMCRGWSTRVSIPCLASSVPDLGQARARMTRPGMPRDPETTRLESNAFETIANRRTLQGSAFNRMLDELLDGKFDNPMLGLLGGYLLPDSETALLSKVVDNLSRLTRTTTTDPRHPDVELLRLRLEMVTGAPITVLPFRFPPTFRAGWDILVKATHQMPSLIPPQSMTDRIACCLAGPGPWVIWDRKAEVSPSPSVPTLSSDDILTRCLVEGPSSTTVKGLPKRLRAQYGLGLRFDHLELDLRHAYESSRSAQLTSARSAWNDVRDSIRLDLALAEDAENADPIRTACERIETALHHPQLREWFRKAGPTSTEWCVAQAIRPISEDETRQKQADRLLLVPRQGPAEPWTSQRLAASLGLPVGTLERAVVDLAAQFEQQSMKHGINLNARSPMARPEMLIPYNPLFLGDGFEVPLPGLTDSLRPDAFADGTVIDYTHYSLVMHARRRLAAFTAHNIDATRMVRASGGLAWRMDERVGENQLGPETYADNQLDRGHLVRREDVAWGTVPEAKLANRASYFYTNAAPQHKNFNQDEWVKLEDWVLDQATEFSFRLCVFTGPVLRADDPTLDSLPSRLRAAFNVVGPVQIPAAFWKLIVLRDGRAGGDDLSAVAFAMKQTEMWNDNDGRRLLNLKVHQVPVAAIEGWTGLDFGPLKNVDELEWSEQVERTRAAGEETKWPVIRSSKDLVYSGTSRRTRGKRAARSAGVRTFGHVELSKTSSASPCGCSGPLAFDARAAVEALNHEIVRLSEALAALQPPAPGPRSVNAEATPAGPTPAEQRAQAIMADAPAAVKAKYEQFFLEAAITNDVARGVRQPAEARNATRIVGGDIVAAGDFPGCVCIGNATQWFCTGVLVAPRVVLTAAHCGRGITRVLIGNDVDPRRDPDAKTAVVQAVNVHPRYLPDPVNDNDINVLILAAPAGVAAVPIATLTQLAAANVELVGFGYNDPNRPLGFGTKRRVTAPMGPIRLAATDDLGTIPAKIGFNADYEFVAGRKNLGLDTCNGDSGGPAYVSDGAGRFVLAGLTSRATREALANCGDGGIYVRLDKFRAWIDTIVSAAGLPRLA